jgi:5'/3'-nucleotidase
MPAGSYVRILLSNDDGCRAEGLHQLAEAFKGFAAVTIVAPDRNRSGASNSLTLDGPLRLHHDAPGVICVDGTPTDCVHLAITGLLDESPDMVVSGINAGANLGDDVLYSGTVAAAMEGRFLGFPAVAVSLVLDQSGGRHYTSAARFTSELVKRLGTHPLPADTILNVNVPDLPWDEIKGAEATRLGHRHRSEPVLRDTDPRGRPIYWIGPPGAEQDAGPGTDFDAIRRRYISVTPIQVDLTRYAAMDNLSQWLQGMVLP